MKFERTEVWGFKHALRGMRNPLASWNKSDSFECSTENCKEDCTGFEDPEVCVEKYGGYIIGPNDLDLAQRLIAGGAEHRKFLRQIFVAVDITAPLYWWKEFDTYKVGTVANSTSTMHKLTSQPITLECFDIDDLEKEIFDEYQLQAVVDVCEKLRQEYLKTKDKKIWKELVRWLPEGWLQTRTVTLNYENVRTIFHQRKNHKLNEWSGLDDPSKPNFIIWIKSLPYAKELILYGEAPAEE